MLYVPHRKSIGLATFALACYLLTGNAQASESGSCVDFESLTAGTRYSVGDTFSDSGVTITVETFYRSDGIPNDSGRAQVRDTQVSGGTGNEITTGNTNLSFGFGGPIEGLSLLFAEKGGSLNLRLNGELRNFDNFVDVNGQNIGGVSVSVVNGMGNDSGTLTLDGTINSFVIGGQELWIDNVCPTGGSPPDCGLTGTEVSPFFGIYLMDSDLPIEDGIVIGLRFGRNLSDHMSLEGEFGVTQADDTFDDLGAVVQLSANLLGHFTPPSQDVRPFVTIGAGLLSFRSFTTDDDALAWNFGAGIKVRLDNRVGLRLDVRDYIANNAYSAGTTHNLQFTAGFILYFQ